MQLTKRAFLLSGAALAVSAARGAFAMGTPSGFAVVGFAKQGDLGEVIVNPYKISPLSRGASFRRLPLLTRRAPFAGTSTLRRFGIPNRSTPRAS